MFAFEKQFTLDGLDLDDLELEDYVTLDVASEISGVSVEELCRAALSGLLPATREPKRAIRVRVLEVLAYTPEGEI